MQIILNILKQIESHQGCCMVMLTIALVACAIASCWIAARSIRLMRELDKKKSAPYVILETTQSIPFYGVRMTNLGLTVARNVTVETSPSLEMLFPNYKKPIGFIAERLPDLVPQKAYESDIGNWGNIMSGNPTLKYQCTVRYESDWGEKYEGKYVLDYSVYEHLAHKEARTLTDLTKRFEEFCREFKLLASGFHKLHVLTEDYEANEEKDRRLVEKFSHAQKKNDTVVVVKEEA